MCVRHMSFTEGEMLYNYGIATIECETYTLYAVIVNGETIAAFEERVKAEELVKRFRTAMAGTEESVIEDMRKVQQAFDG